MEQQTEREAYPMALVGEIANVHETIAQNLARLEGALGVVLLESPPELDLKEEMAKVEEIASEAPRQRSPLYQALGEVRRQAEVLNTTLTRIIDRVDI